MSDNNLKKPFTIRDVLISDIDLFHNNRGETGLSGAGYFHSLLHGKSDVKEVEKVDEGLESLRNEVKVLKNTINDKENIILNLQSQKDNLANDLTKLKESQLKLTSLDYVMTLDLETAKKINRAIASDRKEGLLKNVPVKNYLQNFTIKCLKYTIKNEY